MGEEWQKHKAKDGHKTFESKEIPYEEEICGC